MDYKIAICDDSDADRQYIAGLVGRWASGAGHSVQTALFSSAESFLFHYAEKNDYDILLLDIEKGCAGTMTPSRLFLSQDIPIIYPRATR